MYRRLRNVVYVFLRVTAELGEKRRNPTPLHEMDEGYLGDFRRREGQTSEVLSKTSEVWRSCQGHLPSGEVIKSELRSKKPANCCITVSRPTPAASS